MSSIGGVSGHNWLARDSSSDDETDASDDLQLSTPRSAQGCATPSSNGSFAHPFSSSANSTSKRSTPRSSHSSDSGKASAANESISTPENSSLVPVAQKTPAKVSKLLSRCQVGCPDLSPDGKKVVEEGLADIEGLPSEKQADLRGRLSFEVTRRQELYGSPLARRVLPPNSAIFMNSEHIFEGDAGGGKHFFKDAEELAKLTTSVIPGGKGGAFAVYLKSGKFSTCFPMGCTKEEVETLWRSARVISQCKNRQLRDTGGVLLEGYVNGPFVNSCFPIFYADTYRKNGNYSITDGANLTSESILLIAQQLLEEASANPLLPNSLKYNFPEESACYMDIGPAVAGLTKVKEGVLIKFTHDELQKLIPLESLQDRFLDDL